MSPEGGLFLGDSPQTAPAPGPGPTTEGRARRRTDGRTWRARPRLASPGHPQAELVNQLRPRREDRSAPQPRRPALPARPGPPRPHSPTGGRSCGLGTPRAPAPSPSPGELTARAKGRQREKDQGLRAPHGGRGREAAPRAPVGPRVGPLATGVRECGTGQVWPSRGSARGRWAPPGLRPAAQVGGEANSLREWPARGRGGTGLALRDRLLGSGAGF